MCINDPLNYYFKLRKSSLKRFWSHSIIFLIINILFGFQFLFARNLDGTQQINREIFFGNNIIHCIDIQFSDTLNTLRDTSTYETDIRRFVESGNTNLSIDNFAMALSDFRYALDFANISKDSSRIASIYNLIGHCYDKQYLYDEALKYYSKALDLADKCNSLIEKISALNYTGGIYYNQGLYEKSLNFYVQSLSQSRSINYEKGIAAALNNVGEIYRIQGQLDNALNHYLAALKINLAQNNKEWSALNYQNIGKISFLRDNYNQALEYYLKSLEILPKDNPLLPSIYISVGKTYYAQNKTELAISFLQRAFEIAKSKNDWINVKNSAKLLSAINAKISNYKTAYEYRDKQAMAQDTLTTIITNYRLLGLQTVLDINARDRELERKNREFSILTEQENNVRKQRTWLAIVVIMLTLVAFVLFNWMRNKVKLTKQIAEKSESLRETEQKFRNATTIAAEYEKNCYNQQLKYRHNQIVLLAQSAVAKNDLLQSIGDGLKVIKEKLPNNLTPAISEMLQKIKIEMNSGENMETFQKMLDELNEDFFISLREKAPDLTHRELQLLAMIKLNFTSKEIASLQNIGTKAVEMAKYRLRKRLNIGSNEEFKQLLQK